MEHDSLLVLVFHHNNKWNTPSSNCYNRGAKRFPLSLTSFEDVILGLEHSHFVLLVVMDACVYLLPVSNHPVVSTPTLASLQTDPAGHNDDKSAQIFMSIEFHFGSAHGSFSACFLRIPLRRSQHLQPNHHNHAPQTHFSPSYVT